MAGGAVAVHMVARAADLAAGGAARRHLIAAALMRPAETLQAAAATVAGVDIGGIRSTAAVRIQRRLRRERAVCLLGISSLNRARVLNILRPGITPGRSHRMRGCPRHE